MQLSRLPDDRRLAVVLNKNAKSVTRHTQQLISSLHNQSDVFISESVEHASEIARTIVDRGYHVVATGGGDGTFVKTASDIHDYCNETHARPPRFFVLKLGTGNAMASAFGASPPTRRGLARDLERARRSVYSRSLPVLEVEGKLTPFAGCGLDANVQVDFYESRKLLKDTPLKAVAGGGAGYAISVATRTVPRYLLSRKQPIRVRNVGGPAYRVLDRGRTLERVEPGALLFEGTAMLASASTIPYTGLNMRLFPYARLRDDRFHFRVSQAGVFETLVALPSVWRGTYSSPRLTDFLADRVEVEGASELPLQIGGDTAGMRKKILIELAQRQISMAA